MICSKVFNWLILINDDWYEPPPKGPKQSINGKYFSEKWKKGLF